MERWWADRARAERVADFWADGDDPQVLTGTAFLVLHAIGEHHIAKAAGWQGSGSISKALADIDDDPLIGAVCQVLDDVSGIAGYGAARAAQWKHDADQGAISTVAGMVSEKSPRAMAMKRAAESYGLPSQDAVRIRKALLSSDFVSSNACDRVLMAYASIIANAESSAISKLERDQFEVDGLLRTVNRDKQGRFAAKDKSLEAKQARAKERRTSFMSAAAKRRLEAQAKSGGINQAQGAYAPNVAQMREEPLEEAKAPVQPEEEQRAARIERRKKVMQRAKIASGIQAKRVAQVRQEAAERLDRDIAAMHAMYEQQAAKMADIERTTREAEAAANKPKPKPKPKDAGGKAYKAKKLPRMRYFDKDDPENTRHDVVIRLADHRKLILRVPMMMSPVAGQMSSGGMVSADPVSAIALYAGLGHSDEALDKVKDLYTNINRPDSRKMMEEVEDVTRYVNLLLGSGGDVGRVLQMGEDASKHDIDTLTRKHYADKPWKPMVSDIKRDIATAEKLAKSDTIVWNLPDHQRWENLSLEQATFLGMGTLWHEAHPVQVDFPDGINSDLAGQMVNSAVRERAALEDSAWVVGTGGHFSDYGEFLHDVAGGVPAMKAGTHAGATNPEQLVRFVRALQIYTLLEPGAKSMPGWHKTTKMGFQYGKQIGEIMLDNEHVRADVAAEDVGAVVRGEFADAVRNGEGYQFVQLSDMTYKPLTFPLRKDHTVIKTQPDLSAKKGFDRHGVLGIQLPEHFGVPPVPLLPSAIQHTPKDEAVLDPDQAVLLNIADHWKATALAGGGGMLLKNIQQIVGDTKKKIADHNASEEQKAAKSKQQPPWA